MRLILLVILSIITPTLAIRYLFASDIHCPFEGPFQFNVSYWDGDTQISTERQLTALHSFFFYHEGVGKKDPKELYARFVHDCNSDWEFKEDRYYFKNLKKGMLLYRLDYTFDLSPEDETEQISEEHE